jgi:hemerythrin-like domain-containing protein
MNATAKPASRPPHPVDQLHAEHELMLQVLDAIERQNAVLERSYEVDVDFWMRTLDFLEHFADQFHLDKEAEILFPALERCRGGSRDHGPLHEITEIHRKTRVARSHMLSALASHNVPGLVHATRIYLALMRGLIQREENILLPIALEQLEDEDCKEVLGALLRHDNEQSPAQRERLRRIAADLTRLGKAEDERGAEPDAV